LDSPTEPGHLSAKPHSPQAVALGTAAGIVLVATALFFGVGRGLIDSIAVLGSYSPPEDYTSLASWWPAPLIALGAIRPTVVVCRKRCPSRQLARVTASLTVLLLFILALLPAFAPGILYLWCFPAVAVGQGGMSSIGSYAGAVLQLVAGARLIIWIRPRRAGDEATAA
jgi:hypothetical protein